MLRAYLTMLTKSEFHCLVTGGHATVAGFAFALFVLFGVSLYLKKTLQLILILAVFLSFDYIIYFHDKKHLNLQNN